MIHVRYQGRSYDINNQNVNGSRNAQEIKQFVARFLDVKLKDLNNYVVDHRPNGSVIVRPEAVYG